jgi:hypothetical protein
MKLKVSFTLIDPEYENNTAGVRPLTRILRDVIYTALIFLPVSAFQILDPLHYLNPYVQHVLAGFICVIGYFIHYLIPELLKPHPWLFLKEPLINKGKPKNLPKFISSMLGLKESKIRIVELLLFAMKYIQILLFVLLVLSQISVSFSTLNLKFHPMFEIENLIVLE